MNRTALTLFLCALAVAGCSSETASPLGLANPASENCIAKAGQSRIETAGDGGQYNVCLFEDNRQCEEWALLRGECPVGGRKVTGYVTPKARYCGIRGGTFVVTAEQSTDRPKQEDCTLPGGPACDALALYEGRCP